MILSVNVHGSNGKVSGDIEDMIVDTDNKIVGVIIGVGGLRWVGEKHIGVSLPALGIEATEPSDMPKT